MSALLLLCALFSGHLLAHRQGHDYFRYRASSSSCCTRRIAMSFAAGAKRTPPTCASITAGRTPANRGHHTASSVAADQAPLRFGRVFISSSGLTEATMLPGCGILRIWF